MKKLLFELCEISGVSGSERSVSSLIKGKLPKGINVNADVCGNVIATFGKANAEKHIMLDAHMDQIGFIVTSIHGSFVKVNPCGGFDPRILPGTCVTIHGIENVSGVVVSTPPHLNKADKVNPVNKTVIDVGISAEKVKQLIHVGDVVSVYYAPRNLLNSRVTAVGLDNKIGVAVLLKVVEALSTREIECKVTALLSTQEETTGSGAKVSAYRINADEAIVVDTTFATQPGVVDDGHGVLSHGPMIGVAPTLSREMSKRLVACAQSNNIMHQIEVMNGRTSTNADHISVARSGVETGLVSVPIRYMHTSVEVADIIDMEESVRLLTEYIMEQGESM